MKKIVVRYLSLVSALLLLPSVFAAPSDDAPATKSYPAHGVIEAIAPDRSTVTIHHQAIPGYMMEMTMDFPVKNTNELNGLTPGDQINFTLVVGQNDAWVENIHPTGQATATMTNGMNMNMKMPMVMPRHMDMSHDPMPAELETGDLLPDYTLMTENGTRVRFSDFRGRALAFTFFFTRCPLPNYCPRMNQNFAEGRSLLAADASAPTNWEFLSISFDPAYDTPVVLSSYATLYRGTDASHWLFASAPTNVLAGIAPRLDLMVMRQGNNISHNLRTVVLDPEGRIYHQFDGNTWTAQQLANALKAAANKK